MARVACVGIATLDLVFTVEQLPAGDGKSYASAYREIGGGLAANAAVTVVRLGGEAVLIGAVGADPVGDRIVTELDALGVSTRQVARRVGLDSPVSSVIVDAGGNRMIVNRTDQSLFDTADAAPAERIEGVDAVLVDCRWPAAAFRALASARRNGVPGVVDFDRASAFEGDEILRAASHVIFSHDALLGTTGLNDSEEALRMLAATTDSWLAVTEGADGTLWLDGDNVRREPALTVEVVDTTGAGDVFHGAFALSLAEGSDEDDAVRFATASAAAKCMHAGGRAGIPDRATVDALGSRRFDPEEVGS